MCSNHTPILADSHMGRYYQGVETHIMCHFAWCIARLVTPEQKLVQQFFFFANFKAKWCEFAKKNY